MIAAIAYLTGALFAPVYAFGRNVTASRLMAHEQKSPRSGSSRPPLWRPAPIFVAKKERLVRDK